MLFEHGDLVVLFFDSFQCLLINFLQSLLDLLLFFQLLLPLDLAAVLILLDQVDLDNLVVFDHDLCLRRIRFLPVLLLSLALNAVHH